MRRARITYEGAFHHVMNRGIKGEAIFSGDLEKSQFLDYLKEFSQKMRIRVLAYCVMDNHYHLVIQNLSGRMSDFLKLVNGSYGMFYRKTHGGKGYVFQNRYHSTLIQEESYLLTAIAYVLQNPVRAGLVTNFSDFTWSSVGEYYSAKETGIVYRGYVEGLFESREMFISFVDDSGIDELPIQKTRVGNVLGDQNFFHEAMGKFDRRANPDSSQDIGVHRSDEKYFEPVLKIFQEFEMKIGMKVDDIDLGTHSGKKMRAELLVLLKDYCGLKYKEIAALDLFVDVRANSLPQIYKNARKNL